MMGLKNDHLPVAKDLSFRLKRIFMKRIQKLSGKTEKKNNSADVANEPVPWQIKPRGTL